MSNESVINGRSVPGSGSPAGERFTPQPSAMDSADAQRTALAQKHGLDLSAVGGGDERVLMFEDAPANKQPDVFTAKKMYANLQPDQFKFIADRMNQYYGEGRWSLSGGAGKAGVKGFWEEAVDISRATANLGEPIPVFQAFDQILANAAAAGLGAAGATSGGAGGGGGGGAPQITKTVNLTDPGTAETLVDQALQQYLGRRASETEITEFRKALRKAERKSPNEVDIEGDTQITKGGFNPATFAQQYAEGMEGAAEYQAATTFLDSFIGALGARVDVV